MTDEEPVQLWVHAAVGDTENVASVREDLLEIVIGEAPYQTESYPHVTILPKIELPPNTVETFREAVLNGELTEHPVVVTGTRIWPSENDPRVIMLSVNVPGLEDYRTRLLDLVNDLGGEVVNEPHKPHITLIKVDDEHFDDPLSLPEKLQTELFDTLEGIELFKTTLTSISTDTFNVTDGE